MKWYWYIVLVFVILADLFWNTGCFSGDECWQVIADFRLGRVVSGIIAGAGLSLGGLLLQTVMSNPLAGPYILGISSGAAFGIGVGLMLMPLFGIFPGYVQSVVMALAGAFVVFLMILYVSRRYSTVVVIIAGVLINGFFSALINVFQFFSPSFSVKNFVIWTMASLEYVQWWQIAVIGVVVLIFAVFTLVNAEKFDAMYLGNDYARSLGVDGKRLRFFVFIFAGLVVAFMTAAFGPVAFVGVIAPHMARFTSSSQRHANLAKLSVLWGAFFVVGADWLTHITTVTLPLNTVLSLIGLPVIFFVFLRQKNVY